jgi:hypothetical protein
MCCSSATVWFFVSPFGLTACAGTTDSPVTPTGELPLLDHLVGGGQHRFGDGEADVLDHALAQRGDGAQSTVALISQEFARSR